MNPKDRAPRALPRAAARELSRSTARELGERAFATTGRSRTPRTPPRRRLDHHPDQRLGARGPDQNPPAALELGALPPDRLPDAAAPASASRSATDTFSRRWGSFSIGRASERRRPPSARITSSAAAMPSPVAAKSVQMMWPDCSPPIVQPRSHLLDHVAIADLGRRNLDPGLLHRLMEAVVAHHGHRDAAAQLSPALPCTSAESATISSPSYRRPAPSTASIRSPSPSKAKPISPPCSTLRRDVLEMGRAATLVDVAAVGLGGDRDQLRSKALEGRRRSAVGGAVRAVEDDPAAAQVEVERCSQRAQIVVEAALSSRTRPTPRRPWAAPLATSPRPAPRHRRRACARRAEELDPVVADGLCEAETTAARSKPVPRTRIAAAGVGSTPPRKTSPPAAARPAASADSSMGPTRGCRARSGPGAAPLQLRRAARPSASASSGVRTRQRPPDAVGSEQLALTSAANGLAVSASRTAAACGPSSDRPCGAP